MENKILSIIVPSYNMEAYLPKCLTSLLIDDKDLFRKLDVIVVNDGSKDRTSEIAHEFETKYPEAFRVLDKANGNYGSCINAAIPIAAGQFVKVLDADDSFETSALAYLLKFLDGCMDDVDLVITDYDEVGVDNSVIEHFSYDFPKNGSFSLIEFGSTTCYLSMHAYTYRTNRIREIRYRQLEGVSYSDTEWILLPLVGVRKIAYYPKTVYRYLRGREGQTMESEQRVKNYWMIAKLVLDMIDQFNRMEAAASRVAIQYLRPRLAQLISYIYRTGIFGYDGRRVNLDLLRFDADLKDCSTDFYDMVSAEQYSRRIPYRYISSWRKKSCFRFLIIPVCKTYSWLAIRLARNLMP